MVRVGRRSTGRCGLALRIKDHRGPSADGMHHIHIPEVELIEQAIGEQRLHQVKAANHVDNLVLLA